jgi:hypothetical protein
MSDKISIRPIIAKAKVSESTSIEEVFQNEVLRPIIKMQHDLLILLFKEYIKNKKVLFHEISNAKRRVFIENSLAKDIAFKSEIKGMITGHFTPEEFAQYTAISNDVNKRIMGIIKERLLNSLSELIGG